jgi:hypothetical protein
VAAPSRRSRSQASDIIEQGGIDALRHWLNANKNVLPDRDFFIVGPDGTDILGRSLSRTPHSVAGIHQARVQSRRGAAGWSREGSVNRAHR